MKRDGNFARSSLGAAGWAGGVASTELSCPHVWKVDAKNMPTAKMGAGHGLVACAVFWVMMLCVVVGGRSSFLPCGIGELQRD